MLIHTPEKMPDGSPYTGPEFLYTYANGMKTGSTAKAKGCLIASAQKEDLSLIAVILGDKSKGELERWTDAVTLFDFGFAQYKKVLLSDLIGEEILLDVDNAPVIDGVAQKLKCLPITMDGSYYLMIKGEIDQSGITYEINRNESVLVAPLSDGAVVGTVLIKNNGSVMVYGRLLAAESMVTDEEYRKKQSQDVIISDDTDGVIKEDVFRRMFWPVLVIILVALTILLIYFIAKRKNRYSKVHGRDDYSRDLRRNVRKERERYIPKSAVGSRETPQTDREDGASIGRRVRRK
jgi:dihydroxyacetone kinase DhaKLM complex PTS-EIIA-like component DhaM